MAGKTTAGPEIESLNLEDLDVSALDPRLELTALVPHVIPVCIGNCDVNLTDPCQRHIPGPI
jgi:hypothetical protein